MELALNEMKTQAKKLLKLVKAGEIESKQLQRIIDRQNIVDMKLKHALQVVAIYFGFSSWQQAHEVLSASQPWHNGKSLGSIFYSRACDALTNQWFADYQDAARMLNQYAKTHYLLPFQHQYIVVQPDYMNLIMDLNSQLPKLQSMGNDLVNGYPSKMWDQLACDVLRHRRLNS